MRRLLAVGLVAWGVVIAPGAASAAPIGTNACVFDSTGTARCDIFADYDDGESSFAPEADFIPLSGYLPGYTVLLISTPDFDPVTGNGFDAADVAHVLVITDSLFALHSNVLAHPDFGAVFNAAKNGDGASSGQLAGCPPNPAGVPTVDGVGYCPNGDVVGPLSMNYVLPDGFGGVDLLTIHTALRQTDPDPPSTAGVPEPGTLSLVGLGASALAMRRRRKQARTN
jgi:hypothetical protein